MSEEEFKITLTPNDLSPLFDHDNIHSGKSLELLKKLDGLQGLCKGLSTSIQHGITTKPEQLSQREKIFGTNHPFVFERDSIFDII